VPESEVTVTADQTAEATIHAVALPFLRLDSARLGNDSDGWSLLPIPADQADKAATDERIASPDYSDGYVDPIYDTEWVPDVPVPANLGLGMPPDPTRPVEDDSVFWYRLKLSLPSEWQSLLPGRDLRLSGYGFS